MRAARWLKVSLTISALATAPGVHAQVATVEMIRQECDDDVLRARTRSDLGNAFDHAPHQVWERLAATRAIMAYGELAATLEAYWRTLAAGADAATARRMGDLVDTLVAELRRLDADDAFRTREGPTPDAMNITAGDGAEPWLLNAGDPDNAVAITPGSTTLATARAVCWTAILGELLANDGSRDARQQTARALAARTRRWENFERNGYSLMPLELLLNGWCGFCRGMLEPPRIQVVALHALPTFAVRDSMSGSPALTTEVLGVLFYNQSRSFYGGVAFAATFPTDGPRETGLTFHLSRVGQIGVTFRNDTWTRDNASLLLSADLYGLIDTWRGKLGDERAAVLGAAGRIPGN